LYHEGVFKLYRVPFSVVNEVSHSHINKQILLLEGRLPSSVIAEKGDGGSNSKDARRSIVVLLFFLNEKE
jgi:hypothetical protein